MNEIHQRKIRSFVRRPGRTTSAQRRALESLWPRFGIASRDETLDLAAIFGRDAPVILEIGFGDGEALFTSAANNPHIDHLGIEIHDPGVGHLLILLEQASLSNVRVIAQDAVEILDTQLKSASIDAVRIFFPDPWPKKRHHRRRFIQTETVAGIARILRDDGEFLVASDHANYTRWCLGHVVANGDFTWQAQRPRDWRLPPPGWSPTRYEAKARRQGMKPYFLRFRRRPRSGAPASEHAVHRGA